MQKNIKICWDKYKSKIKYLFFVYFIILTWLLLRKSGGENYVEVFGINLKTIYNDKIAHTSAFLLLTILGFLSYINVSPIKLIFFITLYGVLIEVLQEFMHFGRTFEFFDILADFTGSVLGVVVSGFFIKKVKIKPD